MHTKQIFIVGAGGHGKVVFDALAGTGARLDRIRVTDSAARLQGMDFFGRKIETPSVHPDMAGELFHLAIGSADARRKLFAELTALGSSALTVTHPMASVSQFSTVGDGCFIASQAVIGPAAVLGISVIVNHGAVVDHDCTVGDFAHIAPLATLGGGVRVGARVLVGAGANILPGLEIGEGAVIGAGAVVTGNVAAGEVRVGVPASKKIGS
jgi:sugar O-acyltransferase (sialic acid O-acetyltransferase NeuD family)